MHVCISMSTHKYMNTYTNVQPAHKLQSLSSFPNGLLAVTSTLNGINRVSVNVVGTPGPGVATGATGVVNTYYVRTYWSNHLGLADSSLAGLRYLDDIGEQKCRSRECVLFSMASDSLCEPCFRMAMTVELFKSPQRQQCHASVPWYKLCAGPG